MGWMIKINRTWDRLTSFNIRLYLIWIRIGFAILYWILESIRDAWVFDRGKFLERLFMPDAVTFWMRLLIVFIILLFSIYIHTLKDQKKDKKT